MGFSPVRSKLLRLELRFYFFYVSKVSLDLYYQYLPLLATHLRFYSFLYISSQPDSKCLHQRNISPPLGAREVRQQDGVG